MCTSFFVNSAGKSEVDILRTIMSKAKEIVIGGAPALLLFGQTLDARAEASQRQCLKGAKYFIRNLNALVRANLPGLSYEATTAEKEVRDVFLNIWQQLQRKAVESQRNHSFQLVREVLARLEKFEGNLEIILAGHGMQNASEQIIRSIRGDIDEETASFADRKSAPAAHTASVFLIDLYDKYSKLESKKINQHLKVAMSKLIDDLGKKGLDLLAVGTELGRKEEYPNGDLIIKGIPQLAFVRTRQMNIVLEKASIKLGKALNDMQREPSNDIKEDEVCYLRKIYKTYEKHFGYLRDRYLAKESHKDLINGVASAAENMKNLAQKDWSQFLEEMPYFLAKVCAIWTVHHSKKIYSQTRDKLDIMEPHCIQVLTMFRFMGMSSDTIREKKKWFRAGNSYGIPNHLCQIVTGGGKSIVLGICSTVFALLDFNVHCACYSMILSERDNDAFKEFWELLSVKDSITYSTMSGLAEKYINQEGDIRDKTKQLLESESELTKMKRSKEKKEKKTILLFDEVDVFFQEDFLGNTYNPIVFIWREEMKSLMKYAWDARLSLDISKLKETSDYKSLENEFGSEFMSRIAQQIVYSLQNLSSHDYVATPQGKIGYKMHGTVETNFTYPYSTAFCYLQEVERQNPSFQRHHAEVNLGNIIVGCGNFSYAEIPNAYVAILGVTGTLKPLTNYEKKEIIENMYRIKKTTITPSIYGGSDCRFGKDNDVKLQISQDSFHQEIQKSIFDNFTKGRATLVFFRTNKAMRDFEESEEGMSFKAPRLKAIDEECDNIDAAVVKATTLEHAATLFPRVYGRGLDFKCRDRKMEGGVHVIQAFFSDSLSEEIQIKGRTARQGDKGSYEIIALASDLTVDLGLTQQELVQTHTNSKGSGLYDLAHKARLEKANEGVRKRLAQVKSASLAHAKSIKYRKALVEGKMELARCLQSEL